MNHKLIWIIKFKLLSLYSYYLQSLQRLSTIVYKYFRPVSLQGLSEGVIILSTICNNESNVDDIIIHVNVFMRVFLWTSK